MTFSSENDYRQWLRINGYKQDIIDMMAYNWDTVTIINGEITGSNEAPVIEPVIQDEVHTDEN